MKIRMIALAGVAALALSTPAMAANGWYLGLGGGWDGQSSIKATSQVNTNFFGSSKSGGAAIVAGTVGYAWDNGFRLEDEIAWTGHDLAGLTGTFVTAAGGATAISGIEAQKHPGTAAVRADCAGMGTSCPEYQQGLSAQLRTNVLLGVTGGLGLVTAIVGIFLTQWGAPEAPAPESAHIRVEPVIGIGQAGVRGSF